MLSKKWLSLSIIFSDSTLIIKILYRLAQSLIPRKPGKPQVSIQTFTIEVHFKRLETQSKFCGNNKDSGATIIKLAFKIVFDSFPYFTITF